MENKKESVFLKILNSSIYRLLGIYKNQRINEKQVSKVKTDQITTERNNNKIEENKIKSNIQRNENKPIEIENRAYVSLLKKVKSVDDIKEYEDNENITPFTLKKEFLKCVSCPYISQSRVLGDGKEFHPDVLVVTDFPLSDDERVYLDEILSFVYIKSGRNAYITSLIKCNFKDKDINIESCIDNCSAILVKQIKIFSPKVIFGFGKNSSEYLKKIRVKYQMSKTAFIYTLMPFEIQHNTEIKKKLLVSLKKLAKFLNLPIKKA